MTKAVEDADRDILIAPQGNGMVCVAEAVPPDLPVLLRDHWLSVDNLYVLPARRRQGMGRALMQAAFAWGQTRNLTQVRLGVWHNNTDAKAFYESLGYRELRVTLEAAIPAADDHLAGDTSGIR
ncbi:MAG: GNAT family N-acetyltransferase [Pirellulaceae bacterium]